MSVATLPRRKSLKALQANPPTFKAVTWNVYFGTPVKKLRPVLRRLLKSGVTFFLMQEANGDDITEMLQAEGLETYVHDEERLAWVPTVWRKVKTWSKVLSDIEWESPGKGMVTTDATVGRFEHIASGLKLKALSYKLPPHTQRPEWNENAPARFENTKESIKTLVRMAKNSRSDALLFAGDDNIDESGIGSWGFMTDTAPLTLHQAPKPTHAGGRKIDDFRVAGLMPTGPGSVLAGGGDHKCFRLEFQFVLAA